MAKDTFEKTRDFVEEKVAKTRERVDDFLGDARKQWRDVSKRLPGEWDDVSEEVTKYVKRNPFASIAIAAGVGFLFGLLFSRRD